MADTERIKKVVETLENRMSKLGLHMIDFGIGTNDTDAIDEDSQEISADFREKLASGEAAWIISGTFTVGNLAFSDRILNPDLYSEETEFKRLMPTEEEIYRRKLIDAAKGGNLLAAFEDDDDDDEDLTIGEIDF